MVPAICGFSPVVPAVQEAEIADRMAFLESLAERGICDPPAVAEAVATYAVAGGRGEEATRSPRR